MKKNRSTLKDYFKKGAIPTEANFGDLIDSMLNQEEDGIAKLPNDPLKITAIGVDEALVNFYRVEKNEEKLSWQIKQKPGGASGLNIGDTAASRLFIENGTGYIGIGTTTPKQTLDVRGRLNVENGVIQRGGNTITATSDLGLYSQVNLNFIRIVTTNAPIRFYTDGGMGGTTELSIEPGYINASGKLSIGASGAPVARLDVLADARSGTHPTAVKGLYVTGAFSPDSDGIEFRHSNGTQGIGFGYNTIYATGSLTNQDLGLKPRGTGKVLVTGSLQVSTGQIQLDGAQKIAFADGDTTNNLKVQLWSGYGLGINPGTMFYAANGNHSWRDVNGANERMLLTTGADGGLAVKGTGASYFAGSLNIGATSGNYKLNVVGNALFTGDYLYVNSESAGRLRVGAAWGIPGLYSGDDGAKDLLLGVPATKKVYIGTGTSDAYVEGGTGNAYFKGYLAAKPVYFSAYVDTNSRTGNLNPMPMPVASQNVGNAYNIGTWKFTAPVKGVYLFTMSALKGDDGGDWLNWYLMVNGGHVNAGGTNGDEPTERGLMSLKNQSVSASRTVFVTLNAGDTVWVQQTATGSARVDNFRSGFEGALLFAIP